jgi:hypothetical protein
MSYIKPQGNNFVLPPNVPNHDRCHFTKDVMAVTTTVDSCLECVDSTQLIGGHYQRGLANMQGTSLYAPISPGKFPEYSPILTKNRRKCLFSLPKSSLFKERGKTTIRYNFYGRTT